MEHTHKHWQREEQHTTGVEMLAEAKPAAVLAVKLARGPSLNVLVLTSCVLISSYVPNSTAHTRNVRVMLGTMPAQKPAIPLVRQIFVKT